MVPELPSTAVALNSTSGTAGATLTSGIFDMLGYHYAIITIENNVNSTNATTAPGTLALQTNTTSSTTGMANDTSFGTPSGVALPAVPGTVGQAPYALWGVDWRNRPRYGQVVIGNLPAAGTWSVHVARYRGDRSPVSAADLNVSGVQVG